MNTLRMSKLFVPTMVGSGAAYMAYQNRHTDLRAKYFPKAHKQAHCGFFDFLTGNPVDAAKKDILKLIEESEEQRGDGTSIGPTFVRLAWHASGTYSAKDGTGGSNGSTMRMKPESAWGANAGLGIARDALAPLAAKHGMSHADIWTLAGAAAIEAMGGPVIPWKKGRTDSPQPTSVPDGRLPDADNGSRAKDASHIRHIFGRMGFTDREMVALCGAHAIGRCHTNASGYDGPWTFAETTFSNEYYRLLLEEKWSKRKWGGPMQFEDKTGKIMMLPADVALIEDAEFRKWVEAYAKDEALFFKDFAAAFGKLMELGCKL